MFAILFAIVNTYCYYNCYCTDHSILFSEYFIFFALLISNILFFIKIIITIAIFILHFWILPEFVLLTSIVAVVFHFNYSIDSLFNQTIVRIISQFIKLFVRNNIYFLSLQLTFTFIFIFMIKVSMTSKRQLKNDSADDNKNTDTDPPQAKKQRFNFDNKKKKRNRLNCCQGVFRRLDNLRIWQKMKFHRFSLLCEGLSKNTMTQGTSYLSSWNGHSLQCNKTILNAKRCDQCKDISNNELIIKSYSFFGASLFDVYDEFENLHLCGYGGRINVSFDVNDNAILFQLSNNGITDNIHGVSALLNNDCLTIRSDIDGKILYRSRSSTTITSNVLNEKLKLYFADDVKFCNGFKTPPQISQQEYGHVYSSARWSVNGSTINHKQCLFISSSNNICKHCRQLRDNIDRSINRQATATSLESIANTHIPNKSLPVSSIITKANELAKQKIQLKQRIKLLQEKLSKVDSIYIYDDETNTIFSDLMNYIQKNQDKIATGLNKNAQLADFLRDSFKCVVQKEKGPNGMKGMRWSTSSLQYAMQASVLLGGENAIDKLNKLGIIQLPSGKTIKLKRYNFSFGVGSSEKLVDHLVESNDKCKQKYNLNCPRVWGLLSDEMYCKRNLVYSPSG